MREEEEVKNGDTAEVSSFKAHQLPSFYKNHPKIWFIQVEMAFSLANITADITKFHYVVLNLDETTLPLVEDLINEPPEQGKYEALKERVIETLERSSISDILCLLKEAKIGDDKPTIFVRKLREIAAGKLHEEMLRTIFLEHLSEQARNALIGSLDNLDVLASQADSIYQFANSASTAPCNAGTTKETERDALQLERRSPEKRPGKNRTPEKRVKNGSLRRPGNGVCYYHRRFGFAAFKCTKPCSFDVDKIQEPLFKHLQSSRQNKTKIPWPETDIEAFEERKQKVVRLTTDASNRAIGATLEELQDGSWKSLEFFSRKLHDDELRYSVYDRELLAMYAAVKHFKYILEGTHFQIRTNHKQLTFAFTQRADKATPRQTRQLDLIAQFTTDIVHIKGENNVVTDNLFRISEIQFLTIVGTDELVAEQEADAQLKELLTSDTSLILRSLRLDSSEKTIFCDVSRDETRPYIPESLRLRVFKTVHNLEHPSGKTTSLLIRKRFVWPFIKKDIMMWMRTCVQCQTTVAKVHRHTRNPNTQFPVVSKKFQHVHLEIVRELKQCQGYKYLLTMIDIFTLWPEAIPLKDITVDSIATAFFEHWMCRFGTPETITTGQGWQFESQQFRAFTNMMGCERMAAYDLHTKGILERWHRTFKAALMCHADQDWMEVLHTVLLRLRMTYKTDNCSSVQLMYGTMVPAGFVDHQLDPQNFVEEIRQSLT